MPREDLRAARANHLLVRIKTSVQKTWLRIKAKRFWVFFAQDRRLRADVLFTRAQSTIRADGCRPRKRRRERSRNRKERDAIHHDEKKAGTPGLFASGALLTPRSRPAPKR
jgi:hypothetical protein